VRQTRRLASGTLVTTVYDRRGRVVRETYYWSPDAARLAGIRNAAIRT
jgi:YD repeat-containing protein